MAYSFFPHFTLLKRWLLNTGYRSAPYYLCVYRYSGIICFNHFANQYIMNVCTVIIECAVYAIKYEQGLVWSNCENILTGSTKVFILSLRWCFYRHCIRHMLTPVPTTARTSKLMVRAFLFSLICAWINGWVNNSEVSDFRRNHTHYDVIVMMCMAFLDVLYAQNERDLDASYCFWCISERMALHCEYHILYAFLHGRHFTPRSLWRTLHHYIHSIKPLQHA